MGKAERQAHRAAQGGADISWQGDVSGAIDAGMGLFSSSAPILKDINMSSNERMSEKGAVTHEVNTAGNMMSMANSGAEVGALFGPVGGAVGAIGGAAIGGVMSILDSNNQPTYEEQLSKRHKFNQSQMTKSIASNDTLVQQVQAAEDGIGDVNNVKQIEVEKDEIVLRKIGKAFKKVADFKGGKPHSMGGEDYIAEEGDIIFPGKKRLAVNAALRTRDWKRLESMRLQLPPDTPESQKGEGASSIDPDKEKRKIRGLTSEEQTALNNKLQNQKASEGVFSNNAATYDPHGDGGIFATVDVTKESSPKYPDLDLGKYKDVGYFDVSQDSEGFYTLKNTKNNPANASLYKEQISNIQELNPDAKIRLNHTSGFKPLSTQSYAEGTSGINTEDKNINPKTPEDIKKYIYSKLLQAGLNNNAAKGLIINLSYETNNFKNLEEIGENKHGTKGLGIAQWTDTPDSKRRSAFEEYLKVNNTDVNNIDANVNFLISELKGEQKYNVGTDIETFNKNSNTVKEAAKHALTKFERPQDQSDTHLDKRIELSKPFLKETEGEKGPSKFIAKPQEDPYTIPKMFDVEELVNGSIKSPERKRFEKELKAGDLPYWNTKTGKGKKIHEYKTNREKGLIAAMHAQFPTNNYLADKLLGVMAGTNAYERITGKTIDDTKLPRDKKGKLVLQESGFKDDDPRAQKINANLTEFSKMLAKKGVGNSVLTGLEAFDMLKGYGLTGQERGAAIVNAVGNIMSWYSPEEAKQIIADAKNKGFMDPWTEHVIVDAYNNPENWYSKDSNTQFKTDMITLITNPEGVFNIAKGGVNLVVRGSKGGIKAGKALGKFISNLSIKQIKQIPALAKKAFIQLEKATQGAYKFERTEDLADLQKAVTKLDDSKVLNSVPTTSLKTKINKVYEAIKVVPDKFRKTFTGKTFSEIEKLENDIQELTGKSFSELQKMPKSEIVKSINSSIEDRALISKGARAAAKEAQLEYENANNALKAAVNEAKKVTDKGVDAVAQQRIADLEQKVQKSKSILDNAMDFEKSSQEKVYKYQAVLGDEIKNMSSTVSNEFKIASDNISKLEKAKGSANKAAQSARGSALGQEAITNRFNVKANKFPKLFRAMEENAKLLKSYKSGAMTLAQVAATLENKLRANPDSEIKIELNKAKQDNTLLTSLEPVIEGRKVNSILLEPKGIFGKDKQGNTPLTTENNLTVPTKDAVLSHTKPKIGGGSTGKTGEVLSKIGGGLEDLAGYAPAIYNIIKGLEKPDKIERRFVTPQTVQYHNMSQPQLNLIEDAFTTAISNARNNSGGLMANFRANTEKSWADKIARTAQVNIGEVQRSDKIANANIGIRNQADQINTQTNQKADVMDMQSEAATNSFLAQGIQDIANIASVHKKDRNAEKNQNMMLNMMDSGRDFSFDPETGKIVFKNKTTPKVFTSAAGTEQVPIGKQVEYGPPGQDVLRPKIGQNTKEEDLIPTWFTGI